MGILSLFWSIYMKKFHRPKFRYYNNSLRQVAPSCCWIMNNLHNYIWVVFMMSAVFASSIEQRKGFCPFLNQWTTQKKNKSVHCGYLLLHTTYSVASSSKQITVQGSGLLHAFRKCTYWSPRISNWIFKTTLCIYHSATTEYLSWHLDLIRVKNKWTNGQHSPNSCLKISL